MAEAMDLPSERLRDDDNDNDDDDGVITNYDEAYLRHIKEFALLAILDRYRHIITQLLRHHSCSDVTGR